MLNKSIAVLGILLVSVATQADQLNVMTQNLYLGSSLAPALEAQTPTDFVEGVARIYATVQYTNFPVRAAAIADEILATEPDLVSLQEVSKWMTAGLNPPPGYDFLAILQSELAARGLSYSVAVVSNNANIGPVPLALPGCVQPDQTITCTVQLEDRDVILVNDITRGASLMRRKWSSRRQSVSSRSTVAGQASMLGQTKFPSAS